LQWSYKVLTKRAIRQWLALSVLTAVAASQLACGVIGGARLDKLTLIVTGNAFAYVKDCGCATGQTGGVLRQMRVARQEREAAVREASEHRMKGAAALIEIGNFSDSSTPVKRIESELVLHALSSLQFDAVGLGSREITWPQQDLLALLEKYPVQLTCANLKFTAPKPSFAEDRSKELNALVKPYVVVTAPGGFRIGLIHTILSGAVSGLGELYGFEVRPPAEAARQLLDQHRREADYWIVTVADADSLGARPAGLEELEGVRVVIGFLSGTAGQTGDTGAGPTFIPPPFQKAKDLLVLKQNFDGAGKPGVLNSESKALRADIKFDEELNQRWQSMQVKLEQLAADEANAIILARATAKPPFHVGQNNCIECHKEIVDKLAGSKHNRAYITLVEKQVESNASCVKCHVVGYGSAWGWNVKENQPALQGVQCENCHGPASYHLDIYSRKQIPADLQADGRDKHGLLPAGEATCVKCHDVDNSPNFNFRAYWEQIKH
jgi:hypothetical protein